WRPLASWWPCRVRALPEGVATLTTLAPAGGEIENTPEETGPYVIPVAASSITGLLSPRAYTANRSGTPLSASQASCTEPSRPPAGLGETVTVYAGRPATSAGAAPVSSGSPPWISEELIRRLVNLMAALIPCTLGAASAL